jgi:hypothetical protein
MGRNTIWMRRREENEKEAKEIMNKISTAVVLQPRHGY